MLLGFAITRHCNLRCPHCIRDDVTDVQELSPGFIARVLDEGRALWPELGASFTGGEPLLHRGFGEIVRACAERDVPYRFVTNGWHIPRAAPLLAKYRPQYVRISLSGATEDVHDAERGRGSFRRVLLGVAVLTRLRIPTALSIVIDRRDRHQIDEAVALAESLGVLRLHFILPQPVPGSAARDSDLTPDEWWAVAREVRAHAGRGSGTDIVLDYGAPQEPGDARRCDTFEFRRASVDVMGRLTLCCQLSEYGFNEHDVVADLNTTSLADAWPLYVARLRIHEAASRTPQHEALAALPCMRCARSLDKLGWLQNEQASAWQALLYPGRRSLPVLPLTAVA